MAKMSKLIMIKSIFFLLFPLAVYGGLLDPLKLISFPLLLGGGQHYDDDISIVSNIYGRNFSNLQEAIDDGEKAIVSFLNATHLPSLVFGMAQRGQLIYNKSWGFADLENQVPVDIQTRYRLCSISKTFASALVNQLVQEGRLNYSTNVEDILTFYPKKPWKITIDQLLSHTAGTHVTSFDDFNDFSENGHEANIIRKFQDEPLLFEPGKQFSYSNYGYDMLGAVVEAITGKSYPNHMKEFLKNIGLNNTTPETPDLIMKNRARYYRRVNQSNYFDRRKIPTMLLDELIFHEGWYASGGLVSTVGDLLEWGRILLDSFHDRLESPALKSKTIKQMWSPHTPNIGKQIYGRDDNPMYYGYGWFLTTIDNPNGLNINYTQYIWHSGGLVGTTTMLMLFPEAEIVGVAMTNEGYALGLDQLIIYMAENIGPFL